MEIFYVILGITVLYLFITNWLFGGLVLIAYFELLAHVGGKIWSELSVVWTFGKYALMIAAAALVGYIIFHEIRCDLIHMGIVADSQKAKHINNK